jgi:hypothetical protein
MYTVKVSIPPTWNLSRQSPGSKGIWGNYQFIFNQEIDKCDYWVVYDSLRQKETSRCDRSNTILITGEPSSIKSYNQKFLDQFGCVLTPRNDIGHKNVVKGQSALPWWVGKRMVFDSGNKSHFEEDSNLNYDTLVKDSEILKDRLISVICSPKTMTEGHRNRLSFVLSLKAEFGESIDIYAPGHLQVIDKWDAISRYKYHIVIENERYPDYWTEKLADSYLGGAYPIYDGCSNINDYFPDESFTRLNILDRDAAIESIKGCIEKGTYERSIDSLKIAKKKVLDQYNFFPTIAKICDELPVKENSSKLTIHPENANPIDRIAAMKIPLCSQMFAAYRKIRVH